MEKQISVFIEIEKGSNEKYEFNVETQALELDRYLPEPYVYPYAYGFVPNTLAKDGDELDILIITETPIRKGTTHNVYIVGVLIMEDEQGMDEKVLCVFEEDKEKDITEEAKQAIHAFFTNYKCNIHGKWSRVYGFDSKHAAIELYEFCLRNKKDTV